MELIIVRHARPVRSADSSDPPLSDLGVKQAQLLAQRLATEEISHIVSSTMHRAHQTAQPLAERLGLSIEQRDDLREADEHRGAYVPMEEMTVDDPFVKAVADNPESLFENGYAHFRDGVVAAFDDIITANAGSTVAVICHGMVMASFVQHLWDLDNPFMPQFDYTGICRVAASASKGHRTVRSVNETGHTFELLGGFGSEAK